MDLSPFVTTTQKAKVAVFIDADNVPAACLPLIEERAAAMGVPVLRQLYGDMTRTEWNTVKDYRVTHCTTSLGRNRADMQLVVDAMDVATRGMAASFLIVSDDRDFDPLISWLRAMGFVVDRMGKQKTAVAVATPVMKPAPKPVAKTTRTPLDQRLAKVIGENSSGSEGLAMNKIGNLMRDEPLRETRDSASWSVYFRKRPELYSLLGAGSDLRVRLLP